jgi:hypothetical protein
VNSAAPEISGTLRAGETLTAIQGTWTATGPLTYGYQWLRCDAAGTTCVEIAGATTPTLALTASEAGATIRVRETATSATGSATATSAPTGTIAASGIPPRHVVAVQGPTEPARMFVLVTWDRSDRAAVGYDVVRDGATVGSVTVAGDAWDDMSFTDGQVEGGRTYAYRVRGRYPDGSTSELSNPFRLTVRSDATIGGGRVFHVDDYAGTDLARARAAVAAAVAAGGGIVSFAARTYTFDDTLVVDGADSVVLRGAGQDRTIIEAGFAGRTDSSCYPLPSLIQFKGKTSDLPTALSAPIAVGDRSVSVASSAGLAAGDVIEFDQAQPQADPATMHANGVVQDPGTGNDRRYNWDANEIVAIDGERVTFRYPFSQPFTTAVRWQRLERGHDDGIELLTLQGRDSSPSPEYFRLLDLVDVAHFTIADVTGRWQQAQIVRASGYDVRVVRFDAPDGGRFVTTTGSCNYSFSLYRLANFSFLDGAMGWTADARSELSLVLQVAQRSLVRASSFVGMQRAAINEHGGGSGDSVFENNFFGEAGTAAIFLGNTTWGFGGPAIIRNNTFSNNYRDLLVYENTYETRFLDNVSRGVKYEGIYWAGWAGPDTDPSLHGSSRLTIVGNTWTGGLGVGINLGAGTSPFYKYTGIKDVLIERNEIGVAGTAIRLLGDTTTTQRYQVRLNTGRGAYTKPPFVPGVNWQGNMDGVSYGSPTEVDWAQPFFAWETLDTGAV